MRHLNLKLLTCCLLALSLSACDSKKSNGWGPGTTKYKPLVTPEPLSWTPELETVSCATSECPREVGALFFATKKENNYIIARCTAFLISENTVMSAGHCSPTEKSEGFFLTQPVAGRSLLRRIKSTLFHEFTPGRVASDTTAGRPDVAVFELDQPIQEISPGRLAQGPLESFTQLVAYVLNQGPQQNQLVIDKKVCQLHREEFDFPYDLSENPDMIFAYNCEFVRGNSGSPLFAPGHPEVQAVISGGLTAGDRREQAAKQATPLYPFQLKGKVVTTNVRCLPWPVAPNLHCTPVTDELSQKRFSEYQDSLRDSLRQRQPPQATPGVRYRGREASLQNANASSPTIFEVFYVPTCRTGDLSSSATPLTFQYVSLEFDQWARGSWKIVEQRVSQASIQALQGDLFQLKVDWPEPLAPLDQPEIDVRRWPQPFALSLPFCASPSIP